MKKFTKILFLSLAALLISAGPVLADLGISPGDWIEQHAMPGQQIEKTFYLSRSDASADVNFTAKISGETASWVKIKNGNSFTMPKGQQQYPVNIILTIPQGAEKKEFRGEVRLDSSSIGAQGGQIGLSLSALIKIDVTVTDAQFASYAIGQVSIPNQPAGDAINLALKINNAGNIVAKPTKITVDIFDKFGTSKISSQAVTDLSAINGIAPFSTGDISVKVPVKLMPEQYWADVSVYQDDLVVKAEHLTFNISGDKAAVKGKSTGVSGNGALMVLVSVLLLVVIAVAAGVIIWERKKG